MICACFLRALAPNEGNDISFGLHTVSKGENRRDRNVWRTGDTNKKGQTHHFDFSITKLVRLIDLMFKM